MRQKLRGIARFIMAVSLFVNCIPVPLAHGENEGSTVSIYTAADLSEVVKGCAYDGYSRGKTFVLMNDIDLSGEKVEPIEIFCGVFDGNGHSITNLELSFEGSEKGFFIHVAKEGEIRNLNVQGTVTAVNLKEDTGSLRDMLGTFMKNAGMNYAYSEQVSVTGGLVGTNDGKLVNCGFGGSVKGQKQTGGIAGYNTGVMEGCLNAAQLDGMDSVGGLAGKNSGIIRNSRNTGIICEQANENARNIGGITGLCDGAIIGCVNDGAVGCKNFASNVGGIAGKQSGHISGSCNNAPVSGAKGVGGIAGRFAPYTDIDLSDGDIRQEIENEINQVKDDINGYTSDIRERVTDITEVIKGITQGGWVGEDINRLIAGSETVSEGRRKVLDSLADAINGATGDSGGIRELGGSLDQAAGAVSDAFKEGNDTAKNTADSIIDAAQGAADAVKDAVEGSNDRKDALTDEAKNAIRNVNASLSGMADSVRQANDRFGSISSDISRLAGELGDSVAMGSGDRHKIAKELLDQLEDLDTDVLKSIINSMEDAAYNIETAMRELRKTTGKLSESLLDSLEKLDKQLDEALASIRAVRERIEEAKERLKELLDKIPDPLAPASQEADVQEVLPDTGILDTIEDILSTTASAEENDINLSEDEIRQSIQDIASIDIRLKRDVAGETFDMAVIDSCYNGGTVDGVSAAGGIVGTIGIESAVKSGESLKLPDGTFLNAASVVKAVVDSSINDGNVTAKSKQAGGIAGAADLGIVKNALSACDVAVTEGSHAGGIVGDSGGRIEKCIAICQMEGQTDIGGIAGRGETIRLCYALPTIEKETERMGAIAGSMEGEAESNYFIDEGLTGVNGTDYSGKAVAVSAYDMAGYNMVPAAMAGFSEDDWYVGNDDLYLPQNRRLSENTNPYNGNLLKTKSADSARFHFKVQFINDSNVIKIIDAEYGDILSSDEIPPLENRSGSDARWSRDVTKPILRNTKIEAVYDTALSVISTQEEPPILLVEGNFGEGVSVHAQQTQLAGAFGEDYKKGAAYSFSIVPEKYADAVTRVRVRDDTRRGTAIGIMEDGNAKILNCSRDGSYLVFEVDKPCDFVVLYQKSGWAVIVIGGVLGSAVGGALIGIAVRKRKKEGRGREKYGNTGQKEEEPECNTLPETDHKCLCTAYGGEASGENHSNGHRE